MDNPLQGAIVESLPTPDVNADPSTAPAQAEPVVPAEATAPKAEPKEPPFHEHPRWKEVQDEKRQLADQNRQLMELLQKQSQPVMVQQPQQPENLTPEEKAFWEKNGQFFQKQAEPIIKQLDNKIQELQMTQMSLIYRDFQQRHPDVTPGSTEEAKIANYFKKGLDLDTAYEAVFASIKAQKEIEKVKQSQQVRTQQKIAANVETNTVSPTAIPSEEGKSFRDRLRGAYTKAGVA